MNRANVTPLLSVSRGAAGRLRSRAARARGVECCGALLADATGRVRRVLRMPNAAAEPRHAYLIRPEHVLRVERAAARSGMRIIGYYHCHPEGTSTPSAADAAAAWPSYVYLIVAAGERATGELTAWRLRQDRGGFERVAIEEDSA